MGRQRDNVREFDRGKKLARDKESFSGRQPKTISSLNFWCIYCENVISIL